MIPSDWISVEEELPPKNTYVLAWNKDTNISAIVKFKGTHWASSAVNIQSKNVSYWMHIVPPPIIQLKPHEWKFQFTNRESQDNSLGKK